MAAVGEPRENGYAERRIRTMKEEEVALADYEDCEDALTQIGHFMTMSSGRSGFTRRWALSRRPSSRRPGCATTATSARTH